MPREKSGYPEAFDQGVERQERMDLWAGMALGGLLRPEDINAEPDAKVWSLAAQAAYVAAAALEAERDRMLKR